MATLVPNQSRARTEDEERRRRLPYAPSMTGQSEQRVEQAILRANVDGEDPVEAAQAEEGSAPDPRAIRTMLRAPMSDLSPQSEPGSFQLRPPMSDAGPGMAPPAERLRAPMVAPEPAAPAPQAKQMPTPVERPEDERGRQRARRMAAAMGVLQGTGAIMGLVGAGMGNDNLFDAGRGVAGVGAALPVTAPLEAIDRRAQERAEAEQAAQAYGDRVRDDKVEAEDRSIAAAERALDEEYRRSVMRSMEVNADRREFEMDRRATADARLYDPNHPVAQQRREFLRRVMASAPELAEALEGQSLDALGSADLGRVADQVLRRIGQTPARYRRADMDQLMRIARDLDAEDAPAEEPAPVVETPVQQAARELQANPPRSRLQRAREHVERQQQPAAPAQPNAARDDVLSVMQPPQAAPAAPVEAPPAPAAPRRDRSLTQMYADYAANRRGIALPSGVSRFDDFTPGELQTLARASGSRRAGERDMAAALAGTGGRSQEFAVNQPQTNAYTQADITRMTRPYSEASALARDISAAIDAYDQLAGGRGRHISQAQFEAMRSGGALARLANAERLSSLTAAFTNAQLRNQSGAAVTDSEAARFFRALNMNALNNPAEFRAAIARARRAALNDLEALRNSNPGAYDHLRGGSR